jgi:hypothetical protein
MDVELLVVRECSHEADAVQLLRTALDDIGLLGKDFHTTSVVSQDDAERRGFTGHPAFFVDGTDLFREPGRPAALSCRLYPPLLAHAPRDAHACSSPWSRADPARRGPAGAIASRERECRPWSVCGGTGWAGATISGQQRRVRTMHAPRTDGYYLRRFRCRFADALAFVDCLGTPE